MTIKKRSKHLVVQDNPFRETSGPKRVAPTQKEETGSINGQDFDNSPYREEEPKDSGIAEYGFTQKISFQVAHNDKIKADFWAFVDSVSESYTTNFQQTEKLGSPESIYQYTSTSKTLSISWKAIEDDYIKPTLQEQIKALKKMVYPDVDKHGIPVKPPLVIMNYGPLKEEYSATAAAAVASATAALENDVFGYISSLSIDYSSQELGHKGSLEHPRMVTFSVSFQPINRGRIGHYVE